jgi:hypothetical protein
MKELLFALLGAALAYGVWFLQRRHEKAELRTNMATALLIELKSMDWVLRTIHADANAAVSSGELPMPILLRIDPDVLRFSPQTVFELLTFRATASP